jgi:hypothetical protein
MPDATWPENTPIATPITIPAMMPWVSVIRAHVGAQSTM